MTQAQNGASDKDHANVGDGEVQVTIDGREYTLRPSFFAAKHLSSRYGGIMGALQRVAQVDVEVIIDVICVGLGYTNNKRATDEFKEKIWRAGFTDDAGQLIECCANYLRMLSGGGRPPKEVSTSAAPGDPPIG